MRALNPAKIANNIFKRANSYRFCVHWAPADPRKHVTMNHNVQNMYLDLYEYGEYPDWVHNCSVPARTYEPQVVNIMASTLSQKFGTNITADYIISKSNRSWSKFLSKDLKSDVSFHELYPSLLGKLSQGIFVKESRLTWILEQKARFDYTMSSLDAEVPVTVGDFIKQYNEDIEHCVLCSNYGFAAEIDQAPSALNKHEVQQQLLSEQGVEELKNLDEKHDNFINRLMAIIH